MAEIRGLIAAAGRGTRAGLPYPKTLFSIQGKSILLRILDLLAPYDSTPTVIVSPEGAPYIAQSLVDTTRTAHLVVQRAPRGMGDAVLNFDHSPAFASAEHVLLVWGDIPFIQPQSVAGMVEAHLAHENDFTFVTRLVESAYTIVSRDADGRVTSVVESRELGATEPGPGERDIGLFIFRKQLVLDALREELAGKWGSASGEHGFLYIIAYLAARSLKVEALAIGTELDLVSLNSMKDIDCYI